MTGIIVLHDVASGWGFIKTDDGSQVFYHLKNSPGFKPVLGTKVEFDLIPPRKLGQRHQAANLRSAEDHPASDLLAAYKGGAR